ncbi:hypothetical protein [uncultured Desulfuromusa sp.]|uniref:hypothetical protein n=1 Tax=uncultured Desulfuromusa sp. TaxID=219183 RepID=UPI002AA92EBE|nr:hypothetical protein [uncultured Desulfuromusa sp.]
MSRRAVAVVATGFCTLFIAFGTRYSYGLLLSYMLTSLAISKIEAGVIFSAYFVTGTALMVAALNFMLIKSRPETASAATQVVPKRAAHPLRNSVRIVGTSHSDVFALCWSRSSISCCLRN